MTGKLFLFFPIQNSEGSYLPKLIIISSTTKLVSNISDLGIVVDENLDLHCKAIVRRRKRIRSFKNIYQSIFIKLSNAFAWPILEFNVTCYPFRYSKSSKLIEGIQKYLAGRPSPASNLII